MITAAKVLDYFDWANHNGYGIEPIESPSPGLTQSRGFDALSDHLAKIDDKISSNSNFRIFGKDVLVIVIRFPDGSCRTELMGVNGSILQSSYLTFWYRYLKNRFIYRDFDQDNLLITLNPLPTALRISEPLWWYSGSHHFAHFLFDDLASFCSFDSRKGRRIVSTPPGQSNSEVFSIKEMESVNLPCSVGSVSCWLFNDLVVCPPPVLRSRQNAVRQFLCVPSNKDPLFVYFLLRSNERSRIKLTASQIRSLLAQGVIFVDPARFPIAQMISLLNGARLLIAPHGGEWANSFLSWAKLIFLFPNEALSDHSEFGLFHYIGPGSSDTLFIGCKSDGYSSGGDNCSFVLDDDAYGQVCNLL